MHASNPGVLCTYARHAPHAKAYHVGATGGIGKAIALAFATQGPLDICLWSRSRDKLEAVGRQVEQHGSRPHIVTGDLTKGEDCRRGVKLMGGLDILVNNGACTNDVGEREYGKANEEEFLANFQTHAAYPELKKVQGTVVNMSSMMAGTVKTSQMAYNTSKSMQDAVTRHHAMLYARDGVRVNSVNPGYVLTDVYDRLATDAGISRAEAEAKTAVQHPMGRNATCEEAAAPVLFLASKQAAFITGVSLPVDGGGLLTSWFNCDAQISQEDAMHKSTAA
eukprot:jgi/Astpho2/575/Aster-04429